MCHLGNPSLNFARISRAISILTTYKNQCSIFYLDYQSIVCVQILSTFLFSNDSSCLFFCSHSILRYCMFWKISTCNSFYCSKRLIFMSSLSCSSILCQEGYSKRNNNCCMKWNCWPEFQILAEAVCVSIHTYALKRDMDPSLGQQVRTELSTVSKTMLFYIMSLQILDEAVLNEGIIYSGYLQLRCNNHKRWIVVLKNRFLKFLF